MKISTGPAIVGNFQGNSPLEPEPPAISTAFPPANCWPTEASDCPAFIYTSTFIILTKDFVSQQSLLIYQTAKITYKYTSSLLYLLCVYFLLCVYQASDISVNNIANSISWKLKFSDTKCLVKLIETSKNRHLIENSQESLHSK